MHSVCHCLRVSPLCPMKTPHLVGPLLYHNTVCVLALPSFPVNVRVLNLLLQALPNPTPLLTRTNPR